MNAGKYMYWLLVFVGCIGVFACGGGQTSISTPPELSKAPYNDTEPRKYQAEIWQTRRDITDKYFLATDGTKWRLDSAYGEANQITTLHSDKDYVIAIGSKTYAEMPEVHGYETKREDIVREISYGLLNSEKPASYQRVEGAPGTVTYKVSPDPKEGNESIVTFDEKLGLPVKKEVFSGSAGSGEPVATISINNLSMNVDPSLFVIPKDFKKVPIQDMKSVLTGQK